VARVDQEESSNHSGLVAAAAVAVGLGAIFFALNWVGRLKQNNFFLAREDLKMSTSALLYVDRVHTAF